jgi:hypothetical protein
MPSGNPSVKNAPHVVAVVLQASAPFDFTSTIVLSELVAASEVLREVLRLILGFKREHSNNDKLIKVYAPIFATGVILSFSGFLSAMIVGSLIDDDNVDQVW